MGKSVRRRREEKNQESGLKAAHDGRRQLLRLEGGADGAVSPDGRIMGSYLHGLFASDSFRAGFLGRLRTRESSGIAFEAGVEAALDDLASGLEAALDLDRILEIARAR